MASALRRADLGPVLAALAVSSFGVLLSAAKWRLLLRHVGVALAPARDRLALVAGSILVERLTGFLVMLALCALGIALT
jgi:hypothetical protein